MQDVLIIGGGLAGASAALWLADAGLSARVIEARDRVGGRAHAKSWGKAGMIDLGGGWLRADHALMRGLVGRLGLTLRPSPPLHSHHRMGPAPTQDDLARLSQDAAAIGAGDPEGLSHLTLADWLALRGFSPAMRQEILAFWAISGSGDPARIGANELLTPKIAKGLLAKIAELAFTLAEGMEALVSACLAASGADLHLGSPVLALHDHGTHVTARLEDGSTHHARAALVALPLNTLGRLHITPALPAPVASLATQGHLGRAIKLMIAAEGPRPGALATGLSHGLRWFWVDRDLGDGSTLVVGFGLFDEAGPPEAATLALALAQAFPGARLKHFDWHDWCADPFAHGTWVSPALDTLPLYDPAHWAPRGRLAFAGSDLASAEQGWFEGALLAARDAVAALTQLLTKDESP